jgi:hypothetical protein
MIIRTSVWSNAVFVFETPFIDYKDIQTEESEIFELLLTTFEASSIFEAARAVIGSSLKTNCTSC